MRQAAARAGLEVIADQSDFKLTTAWVVGAIGNGESNYRTRLKANALLAAAGFSSLHATRWAECCCGSTSSLTSERQPWSWKRAGVRFVDDGTEEFDKSKVANVVHIDYSTSDESIRGTAIDSDPNSEYSTVRRGWRKAVFLHAALPHGSTAAERQANANAEAQSLLVTAIGHPPSEGHASTRPSASPTLSTCAGQARVSKELRDQEADSHPRGEDVLWNWR